MTESPLKTKDQRIHFCDEFFAAVNAPPVYSAADYREYQLPRDIDKELTDRPYYWLWVEQTGQKVEPTVLRLAFSETALQRENQRLYDEAWAKVNPEEMTEVDKMFFRPPSAELISLGSFRLERIMDAIYKRGRTICIKPQPHHGTTPLVPWLLVNSVLSYACDLTEQHFISIGICLTNGQIVEDFWKTLFPIPMVAANASEVLGTKDLLLQPETGLRRLQDFLGEKLHREPHQWALDAQERLQDDLQQLDLYYSSLMDRGTEEENAITSTEHRRKRSELIQRAEPRIEIEVSQLALVGLIENVSSS